jgi:hypothetical protein
LKATPAKCAKLRPKLLRDFADQGEFMSQMAHAARVPFDRLRIGRRRRLGRGRNHAVLFLQPLGRLRHRFVELAHFQRAGRGRSFELRIVQLQDEREQAGHNF